MKSDIITYLEIARIAFATVPELIEDELDINDNEFIRLRDGLIEALDNEDNRNTVVYTEREVLTMLSQLSLKVEPSAFSTILDLVETLTGKREFPY